MGRKLTAEDRQEYTQSIPTWKEDGVFGGTDEILEAALHDLDVADGEIAELKTHVAGRDGTIDRLLEENLRLAKVVEAAREFVLVADSGNDYEWYNAYTTLQQRLGEVE